MSDQSTDRTTAQAYNRALDHRGRITIPSEVRDRLGLEEGDQIDIEIRVVEDED